MATFRLKYDVLFHLHVFCSSPSTAAPGLCQALGAEVSRNTLASFHAAKLLAWVPCSHQPVQLGTAPQGRALTTGLRDQNLAPPSAMPEKTPSLPAIGFKKVPRGEQKPAVSPARTEVNLKHKQQSQC